MSKYIVKTAEVKPPRFESRKEIDASQPGNIKWLVSHIKWATKNNRTVTIEPIL